MEIAGLVLTVLPMVAQTFNGYTKAADALSNFMRYSNVVTNLKMRVRTQEVIFRNSSENLRSTIERYVSTIDEGQSFDAQARTVTCLETSLETCRECLLGIKDFLNTNRQKLEGFKTEGDEIANTLSKKPPINDNIRLSFKECSARIKLAWTRTRIDDAIEDLRGRVHEYDIISQQAISFMIEINPSARRQPRQSNIKRPHETEVVESMEGFKIIRQASTKLYYALAKHWLCRTHERHRINICSAKCSNERCLYFEAVLAVHGSDGTNEPICVGVELVDPSDKKTIIATKSATTSPIEQFEGNADAFESMQVDSDPGPSTDTEPGQWDASVGLNVPEPAQATAADLMKIQDFCQHFQRQYETMRPGKCLLGYLSELTEHRFYSLDPDRRFSELPRSLADYVSSAKVLRPLSRLDSVGIAASLATCVLQFYSTPWLPRNWSSKNVTFFRTKSYGTDTFNPLHFSIQLEQKADKGKGVELGGVPSVVSPGSPSVRNELLFQFGLVLLETGLARPWDSMRREMVESMRIQERSDDYHIAYTLAQDHLQQHMGEKYSRIVRKCLGCDFGLGDNDFDSEKLQAVFHRDVVEALHALESKLVEYREHGTV